MVEPLLSPDVLAQVVSRVHRIRQTKKTHVHIFITEKAIEKDIYKLHTDKLANRNSEPGSLVEGRAKNTRTGCSRKNADTLSLLAGSKYPGARLSVELRFGRYCVGVVIPRQPSSCSGLLRPRGWAWCGFCRPVPAGLLLD